MKKSTTVKTTVRAFFTKKRLNTLSDIFAKIAMGLLLGVAFEKTGEQYVLFSIIAFILLILSVLFAVEEDK